MGTNVASIDVEVPLGVAWDLWTNVERFSIVDGVDSVTEMRENEHHWVTRIAGVEREFDSRIVAEVPKERIEWVSTDGVDHRGAVTFDSADQERTTITVHLDLTPGSFAEEVADRVGLVKHRLRSALADFKLDAEALLTGAEHNAPNRAL